MFTCTGWARKWLSIVQFVRLANTLLKDEEGARDNHVYLLVTLPDIHRLKKFH